MPYGQGYTTYGSRSHAPASAHVSQGSQAHMVHTGYFSDFALELGLSAILLVMD